MNQLQVRLLCPTKNPMQSGLGRTKKWLLEFPVRKNYVEPTMGLVACRSTAYETSLWFDSKEQALEYAKARGIEDLQIIEPSKSTNKPKSYGEHFKAGRVLK